VSSEKQHLVPKFLLRGFTAPSSKQLFVFDKTSRRVFSQSPDRAAKEGGFYDLQTPVGTVSLEKSLADLESRAAEAIADIRKHRSLTTLTQRRAADVAHFAAVQLTRTSNYRKKAMRMSSEMAAWAKRMADARGAISDLAPLDEEGAKLLALHMLAKSHELAPHFLSKAWMLLSPPPGLYFLASDNPVTLHNSLDLGWMGNLGLAVRGIEIYLPLSRDLTLAFLCPSHITNAEDGIQKANELERLAPEKHDDIANLSSASKEFLESFTEGAPWLGTPDNVLHMNSLQVWSAERYLYGPTESFHPAGEMLDRHPHMAEGPRLKFN
jgi:hypothetical protein